MSGRDTHQVPLARGGWPGQCLAPPVRTRGYLAGVQSLRPSPGRLRPCGCRAATAVRRPAFMVTCATREGFTRKQTFDHRQLSCLVGSSSRQPPVFRSLTLFGGQLLPALASQRPATTCRRGRVCWSGRSERGAGHATTAAWTGARRWRGSAPRSSTRGSAWRRGAWRARAAPPPAASCPSKRH